MYLRLLFRGLQARGLSRSGDALTIKDEFLRSVQRQRQQNPPTDVAKEIANTAYSILIDWWNDNKPVRMITVCASNLIKSETETEQISFFDQPKIQQHGTNKKREKAVDKIRQKYGNEAIINGAIIDTDIGIQCP